LLTEILKARGYQVYKAIDGQKAIEIVKKLIDSKEKVDLIIMDYRMHGLDGLETSKIIWELLPNAKILFASADYTVKEEVINNGAVGFLKKPFRMRELLSTISIVLQDTLHK